MDFESALRLWGAVTLMNSYSGLTRDDIDVESVSVDIRTDPGCPTGEDSYYAPASAVVEVSGVMKNSAVVTPPARYFAEKREPETFPAGKSLRVVVEYPDMMEIAREASALVTSERPQ